MAYTLNSKDLGIVKSESVDKSSNLEVFPMPMSDSDDTLVFDYNGAKREITIEGTFCENSLSLLRSKVEEIENLINGQQSSPYTYHSDFIGSVKVKIDSFSYRRASTETGEYAVHYTLRLIECSL